ncbi:hypothetical protein E4U42_003391 [Claviceps africana]|uniref:Beta-xylosidase C-terminal Concanavalin A-like domain-containing protein n=1 Tax=Claviceps africana TaxID=83212 RepID=A0A8K0J9B9_9HYPO|nr:hypothetical protein E4U42_003391 [Claviceps africana]
MIATALLAVLVAQASATSLASQPVLWEDLADLDVFRVGDDFYYSASTMHYSPGAPLLHSTDLINWAYIGHSVPQLSWGSKYSLQGGNAYVKGVFASSVRRRPSDGTWFWVGCVEYSHSYIYSAPSATGPWTKLAEFPNQCFYDCGLLFDDDDTPYVAYGSKTIQVARLSSDLKTQVGSQAVYTYDGPAEGSRMYKIKDTYYILNIDPGKMVQYVIKAKSIHGPYESATLLDRPSCPIPGARSPHQGGIVDDPQGNWYYMAFCDAYPGGRVPVLSPISFDARGFPQLRDPNKWPSSVTTPMGSSTAPKRPSSFNDTFQSTSLGPSWEWNHNPLPSAFSLDRDRGLTLRTATVTNDIYQAQNTLTHRIPGPRSNATIKLSFQDMKDGDRAGLVLLRDLSAWVGVVRNNGAFTVAVWTGCSLTMASNSVWSTASTGSMQASASIPSSRKDAPATVWLRAAADIDPSGPHTVDFSYSLDGQSFQRIGSPFVMQTTWQFYMGYRYGIFNFATQALGGSVLVESFTVDAS